MPDSNPYLLPANTWQDLQEQVAFALTEDIGDGDLTAQLIPAEATAEATIITREDCILCGRAWVETVFQKLGAEVEIQWDAQDGDQLKANDRICTLKGNSRAILTGERTALNFLQTLSGTATVAKQYASQAGKNLTVLDTRKTIPGLRTAQKYAVTCGGCENHRIGLYDAFLIKENHIAACGSIQRAIEQARRISPDKKVIVEVESLEELKQAVSCQPDQIMLDNFSNEMVEKAIGLAGDIALEISGNIDLEKLGDINSSQQMYTSSGSLTKHLRAIDLSLRIESK